MKSDRARRAQFEIRKLKKSKGEILANHDVWAGKAVRNVIHDENRQSD